MVGQVKVWREATGHLALFVPLNHERSRLVLPGNVVEVEYARDLRFRFVGKANRMPGSLHRLVVIPEVLLEHSYRTFELRKERDRDFDGLLSRNRISRVLLFYHDERMAFARSEERRVGKECRSRWSR